MPELIIVCEGIVDVPLGVNPVIVPGFDVAVQLKVAPETFDVSVTGTDGLLEQMDCVKGEFETVGLGFTII